MRHIEVQYQDGTHAFVDDYLLDPLIRSARITHFYRPSESRWITVGVDPIRKKEGHYPGKERRRTGHLLEMIPLLPDPTLGKSFSPGRI
jgi:hypothetical protein